MSIKILLIAAAIATCGAPVLAEPIAEDAELGALYTPGGLTAEVAARRARNASPAVWRRVAELESAIVAVDTAKLGRIPQVTLGLSYTRLSDLDPGTTNTTAGAGAGFSFPIILDNYAARAQVVVPLSDYVLRHPHAIGAARIGVGAARESARATTRDAAITARRAYYEWIRARLQRVIAERQLGQVQSNLGRVRDLVAAGRAPRAELLRIESQEAETEQLVDRLRTTAELREHVLRLQIGAAPGEPLAIGEDVRAVVTVPAAGAADVLAEQAIRRRPELRALRLAMEANEHRRLAERANALPKLSALATTEYSNPNQRAFPPDERFTWTWSAGLQATWTLEGALHARTATRRLAAEARGLDADREAVSRDIRIAVLAARQHVENAKRAISTTAKGLDAAEEGYRVRRALLAAERVTAVELVDAETDLARARIAALDARIDLRIAIADLDHAAGADL